MNVMQVINAIDSHTEGEPTRVIISGLPFLNGGTVAEKRDQFKAEYDFIRKAVLWEPRGHRDMFGAVLLPPSNPKAECGAFFLDSGGYLDMCGHGSIGLITTCFSIGMISKKINQHERYLDTPAGLVRFKPEFKHNKLKAVTVQNVPSFLLESEIIFNISSIGNIKADVAYAGNFFLLTDSSQFGMCIEHKNLSKFIELGLKLREKANQVLEISHPKTGARQTIDAVEFYEELENSKAHARNIVIFGSGQVDRSPCGTGTCAKMASLHAKGMLNINTTYINQGILGRYFIGKIIAETKVGKYDAVIPEITGRAWITGFNQFVIDPEDPFATGFLLV